MPASDAATSGYEVYTDGSYLNGNVAYAFVILEQGVEAYEDCGVVPPGFAGSRQVGGEIYAVLKALDWFEEHGVGAASVHYDFANLALWVSGAYKANTFISRTLVERVRGSKVQLSWRKVRAHTGVRWNERVDELAKSAALGKHAPLVENTAPVESDDPADIDRPASSSPLIAELERIVDPLQEAAAAEGIDTRYVGILNGQFARLEILKNDKRVGMFDLYNTQKKRLNPIISPAGSPQASRMAALWSQFIAAWR